MNFTDNGEGEFWEGVYYKFIREFIDETPAKCLCVKSWSQGKVPIRCPYLAFKQALLD